jgi:hypothetical protein
MITSCICFQLVQDQFVHITNGKVLHFLHIFSTSSGSILFILQMGKFSTSCIYFQLVQDQFFHITNGEVMLSFFWLQFLMWKFFG